MTVLILTFQARNMRTRPQMDAQAVYASSAATHPAILPIFPRRPSSPVHKEYASGFDTSNLLAAPLLLILALSDTGFLSFPRTESFSQGARVIFFVLGAQNVLGCFGCFVSAVVVLDSGQMGRRGVAVRVIFAAITSFQVVWAILLGTSLRGTRTPFLDESLFQRKLRGSDVRSRHRLLVETVAVA